jgi:hypothetical protein
MVKQEAVLFSVTLQKWEPGLCLKIAAAALPSFGAAVFFGYWLFTGT